MNVYEPGDVITVNFDPTKGHEPAKQRPALVVSSFDFNASNSMTIVCPISTRERPFFLHEQLPEGSPVQGSVIMEQIRAIDLGARPHELIGRIDDDTLHRILVCLRSFFEEDRN